MFVCPLTLDSSLKLSVNVTAIIENPSERMKTKLERKKLG